MSWLSFLPNGDPLNYVGLAFDHRYVTAAHLQQAFDFNSYRTAQHHVTRLTRDGLLADVPVFSTLNNFPGVYVCTGKGVNQLAKTYEQSTGNRWRFGAGEQRRAGRPRRLPYIEHELDTTSVDLAMLRLAASRDDVSLPRVQRRYHRRGRELRFRNDNGQVRKIIPDSGYYFLRTRNGRRWLDLCFLEMDRGSMSSTTKMVEKFARYEEWNESSEGERYLLKRQQLLGDPRAVKGRFRLLVVARSRMGEGTDAGRLAKLVTATLSLSAATRRRIWLTTWEALVAALQSGQLNAPIWLWGRDISAWQQEFDKLDQRLPENLAADRKRRQYLVGAINRQTRRRICRDAKLV